MTKAKILYTGTDSYGRGVEVAQSTDGAWFFRSYGFNGYGMSWARWQALEAAPHHPAYLPNRAEYAEAPEYVEIPQEHRANRIEWGFNTLTVAPDGHKRLRLPD